VVPEISGPSNGETWVTTSFLANTYEASCLPAGEYRFEAYLNGRLVDSKTVESSHRADRAALLDRRLGMALCVPDGWAPKAQPGLEGLVSKWESGHGTQGAVVMRLDRHSDEARSYGDGDAARMLAWAMRRFPRVLPHGVRARGSVSAESFPDLYPSVGREFKFAHGRLLAVAGYDEAHVGWVGLVYGSNGFADGDGRLVLRSLTQRIA
jgi:hypothetical protein